MNATMTAQDDVVRVWRAAEWQFSDPGGAAPIDGVFTGPDGSEIRRRSFRIAAGRVAIRFAPTLPGPWSLRWDGGDALASAGGTIGFEAMPADGEGPLRHGFLRVAPERTHLEHRDGTPFLWLGDTHWRFTSESWDTSNKPGWSSQFRGSVDRRVQQGFSVYQANLMVLDWGADTSRYFVDDGDELDLDFLREVVDPRLRYVADAGLVIALGLGWHQAVDERPERLERLARHVVARYGAYPVVWTLGGEVPGYEPELRQQRLDRWRRVAELIRSDDGYRHPITSHATNERPLPAYYAEEPWFDLALNQHGHGDLDLSPTHYAEFFARHPGIPMVEGETLYEALTSVEAAGRRTVDDTMVRQAAYRAMQSGCCGFSYGAQGGWNGAWERGSFRDMWGDRAWYDGVDLPGAEQLGYLRRFYEALPWHRLRPVTDCFVAGDPLNAAFSPPLVTADEGRSVVVVHFDERYRLTGLGATLTGLVGSSYGVTWFDPVTGRGSAGESRVVTEGSITISDPPEMRDWLLVARSTG